MFLQSAHKQGNPSFHFHAPGSKRRYPCTQTASVVQKYFPCQLQFCTGCRIWHASRAWKRKTFIFTQLKISRYNPHFFAIFRRIPYKMISELFTVVWPVWWERRGEREGKKNGLKCLHIKLLKLLFLLRIAWSVTMKQGPIVLRVCFAVLGMFDSHKKK